MNINTEWLRLCRRPLLSTEAISYCLLVTSERCLEGEVTGTERSPILFWKSLVTAER